MKRDGKSVAFLDVRVQPRASSNGVVGFRAGALAVRVSAAPVEGAANRACRQVLAESLGVKRADIELIGGETSRNKRFRIRGLTQDEVDARLRTVDGGG